MGPARSASTYFEGRYCGVILNASKELSFRSIQRNPNLHAAHTGGGIKLRCVTLKARSTCDIEAALGRPFRPDDVDRFRNRRNVRGVSEDGIAT